MLIVFLRAIIIYICLVIAMRLMGKKQLGELQPFEFTVTLIAAELACIPMSDTTTPIAYGVVPIFTLFIIHLIFAKVQKHSIHARKILNGKPIIVIDQNGINAKALDQLDMTVNDLMQSLRGSGYFTPSEVMYAIVETNGNISIMPKAANAPVTAGDMSLNTEQKNIPYMIICEGKLLSNNIQLSGIEANLVDKILKKYKLKQKNILLLTVCNNQDIFLQPKDSPAVVTTVEEVNK